MFEKHKITTEDGYILTAFRVPGALSEFHKENMKKQPIYMQHGLMDAGGTWFFNDETTDLALLLAGKGFDIWITNSRGSVYSNEHIEYSVKDSKYWDFSVHEMG